MPINVAKEENLDGWVMMKLELNKKDNKKAFWTCKNQDKTKNDFCKNKQWRLGNTLHKIITGEKW